MPTYDSRFDKEVVKTIKGVNMVSDIVLDFETFFLPNKRHIAMIKKHDEQQVLIKIHTKLQNFIRELKTQ